MFENVIGQEGIISRIQEDIVSATLPSSLLFHGSRFTGKQTAALETARVLLCEDGSAKWNCSCRSCELNRRLVHPGLVLIGPHHFTDEIAACADVYLRQERKAGAFLFIRSLMKCIRRFDPHAFEAGESKEKKIRDLIAALEEGIQLFDPEEKRPEESKLKKMVDAAVEKAAALAKEYPSDNIPISAVRNITAWVHTTGSSNRKVVIIENCEKMGESSRNALLKILEEPPKGVYFICITTRKGMIIPTILSRLRQYQFRERNDEEERKVLKQIFGEKTGEYPGLESYFLAWRNIKTDDLHAAAGNFIRCLKNDDPDFLPALKQIADSIEDKNNAYYFLKFLTDRLQEDYLELQGPNPGDITKLEEWNRSIRECLTGINLFNQRPAVKLEELFYTMRLQV